MSQPPNIVAGAFSYLNCKPVYTKLIIIINPTHKVCAYATIEELKGVPIAGILG